MTDKHIEHDMVTEAAPGRALLVGVYKMVSEKPLAEEHLEELHLLARTHKIDVAGQLCLMVREFCAATFLRSGKLAQLREKVAELHCSMVIFDDEITPVQQRNLEAFLHMPVMDRTELILAVFGDRARSHEAQLQIEMAHLEYIAPRLKRMWLHLSRQTGGGGGIGGGGYLRGKGETQIEMDRRALKRRKEQLAHELKEVEKYRTTQKSRRVRTGIPTFALIGYTNAGKSTLLNALTDADVFVENMLFATLDTTTRTCTLPNNQTVLVSDTVGFIRKLPHLLVAAFKSTLEEALDADVLIHLIDSSHPQALEQAKTTFDVLKELQVKDRPIIPVINKIDTQVSCNHLDHLAMIQKLRMAYPGSVQISALTKEGFGLLYAAMMDALRSRRCRVQLRIPQSEYQFVAAALEQGKLFSQEYEGNDCILDIELPTEFVEKMSQYRVDQR